MLEIVHDLAPGAELWFGNWGFATILDFNAAVDCLALNTHVVVDDIGFFNAGPYDGTSLVSVNTSTELNKASNRIRAYATSVANQAKEHYESTFVDSGTTLISSGNTLKVHRFQTGSGTDFTGSPSGFGCQNPALTCATSFVLSSGEQGRVFMQWNDPVGGSSNDYDLFLWDRTAGQIVASSETEQSGTQHPVEGLAYVNPHGAGTFDVIVAKFSGANKVIEIFTPGNELNFRTLGGSVPNQSDAGGGVLSVGAINAADAGHDTIASYSSRGPTADGRTKPDVTGIDGVDITGAGGFSDPFFGTSAAAPHIGGVLALLLSAAPELKAGGAGENAAQERSSLRNALVAGAHDLGVAGPDNIFGAGRVDAEAAATFLPGGGNTTPCVRDATTACLVSNRFEVKVNYQNAQSSGTAQVMSFNGQRAENDESAFLYFTSPTNFEMGLKVLNACGLNNKFWVFIGGLTDQGWAVAIRDAQTGATKTYSNSQGHLTQTVADTAALNCP